MRPKTTVALALLLGLAFAATGAVTVTAQTAEDCGFPYETTGTYGETTLEEEPEDIVTLAPSVSQTLWEIEAQDKVTGMDSFSFYLEETEDVTDVGTAFDPSFPEQVVAQEPDLVLGALLNPDQADALDDAGLEYHTVASTGGFDGIYEKVEELGRLVGECEGADETVADMKDTVAEVESAVDNMNEPLVMFGAPSEGQDNFVPVKGTFKHDIITTAGGENVYATIGMEDEDGLEQLISDEKVAEALSEDPDWIVLAGEGPEAVPNTDMYNQTTAVQEDQILTVNRNYINQEAPRILIPLERMARAFHPDAFADTAGTGGGAGAGLPEPDVGVEEASSGLSVADGVSRAEFADGPVDAVEVHAELEGEVTVSVVDTGDAPGTPVQRVTVSVPEEARDLSGTVRFLVDSDRLEAADVPADDLLAVKDDNGWTPLETAALETDDGVTVVADTPSFSDFAVVASTPPVVLADASVDDGTVTLSAADSYDEYGDIVDYGWSVDGETYEGETVEVEADEGEATLTVTNDAGLTNETTVEFSVDEETADYETGAEEGEADDVADDEPTEEEGLPGFTAVAALVALLSFALVRR